MLTVIPVQDEVFQIGLRATRLYVTRFIQTHQRRVRLELGNTPDRAISCLCVNATMTFTDSGRVRNPKTDFYAHVFVSGLPV